MESFGLKCFGVGDGLACGDRNHSSYLYRVGDASLLIDCGEPVSRSYKATGLSYELIDRIFISHLHADHIGGFFMLLQGIWLEERKKDLQVHLPGGCIPLIRQMLHAGFLFQELMTFRLNFLPLVSGQTVVEKNLRITPFPTTHLESLRRRYQAKYPGEYAAFSFLLESERWRVAHSADIGAPEDLAPLLTKPLDLLVCELAHVKPEELFAYLKGRDIKRIIFTHGGRY